MRRIISKIGPGIITAALVFGPGSLTVNAKLGSQFGYGLLWVIPVATFFMMLFTEMASRVGLSLQQSTLHTIGFTWGRPLAILNGLGIFLVASSFQAGNAIGAGVAFAELSGGPTAIWVLIFTVLAIALLRFKSFYKILEKIMLALVAVMLLSFLITAVAARPDLSELLQGLIPGMPEGSQLLTFALVASSFSIVGAFHQSYVIQEKSKLEEDTFLSTETYTGILLLGGISCLVMICASGVLFSVGKTINSPGDLGLILEPLLGSWAKDLFMIGLFSASFSSLIGNASLGGTLLADTFHLGSKLSDFKVRLMVGLVILTGTAVALIFGKLPIELIIFAQAVTLFIAPLIGISLFLLANNKSLMQGKRNNWFQNGLGMLGIGLLILLSIRSFIIIFL
jgi:manganese transport protein